MAASKPKGKTPAAKPTVKEQKAAKADKLGYANVGEMKSASKFYKAGKSNVTPRAKQLEAQLASQGYTKDQPVAIPINIGGTRWLVGAGQMYSTGERSDAAKRNPGAAYNAPGSVYNKTVAASAAGTTGAGTATADGTSEGMYAPWENIDLAGGGVPLTAEDIAAGPVSGAKNKKNKKKGKAKAKKTTTKAKAKSSPGGSKVTPRERKGIQAVKANNRKGGK